MLRPVCCGIAATALLLVSACASVPAAIGTLDASTGAIELEDTPFFPQQRYQCGPAALATILAASGREVAVDELVDRVYLPARQGSLQAEMLGATRALGRIPYRIDGTLSAVALELAAGRPVLVLQNLGVAWLPKWHYAVVVGLEPGERQVVLRSGTESRRRTGFDLFLRTWQRSGYWAFVALPPGELPADPDRERYFGTVADMEAVGRTGDAREGWHAAARRWPRAPLPWFGLGNAALADGDYAAAESHYRDAIDRNVSYLTAYNNLAYALAGQGHRSAALATLDEALSLAAEDDHAARSMLEASRLELDE